MKSMLFFFLATSTMLAQPVRSEADAISELQVQSGIYINTLEELETAPPKEAWTFFYGLIHNYRNESFGRSMVRRAGMNIGNNVQVEQYVQERLAALPHNWRTTSDRSRLLLPLGDVPKVWALEILGRYLYDDRAFPDDLDMIDQGGTSNAYLASIGLSRLNLKNAPISGDFPSINPNVVDAWKGWWVANKDHLEERIREIAPEFTAKSVDAKSSLSGKPRSNSIKSEAVEKTSPAPALAQTPSLNKANQINAWWYIAFGLLALLVILFVIYFKNNT